MSIAYPTSGLRERKRLATRRALQESALRLVAEYGLEAVTVEDISSSVDVSSRTFFNYFPTKEDALAGDQQWLPPEDEARRILLDERGPDLAEDLHRLLRAAVPLLAARRTEMRIRRDVFERHPGLLRVAVSAFLAEEKALENLIAERTGGATPLARLLAMTTTAVLRTAIEQWLDGQPECEGGPFSESLSHSPPESVLADRIDVCIASLRDVFGTGTSVAQY